MMIERLREVWSSVLNQDKDDIEDDDNFFEIGGDSVVAMRLVAMAQEAKLNLTADTVFKFAVLVDMAAHTTVLKEAEETADAGKLDADLVQDCAAKCGVSVDMIEDVYRCPTAQSSFLEKHVAAVESGILVERLILEVEGTENTAKIQSAFEIVREKNAILRTSFVMLGQDPFQVVIKENIQWSYGTELNAFVHGETNKRFAFGDPLTRYGVVKENGKAYIVWTVHHSVEDEWSRGLLLQDLKECLADPEAFAAKPARPSFKAYTEFTLVIREEAIAWWKRYLAGAKFEWGLIGMRAGYTPVMNASLDRTLLGPQTPRESFTISNLAHAAFTLALFELSNRPNEVTFRTIRMGRQIPVKGIENTMGQFFNVVVLRLRTYARAPIRELLSAIRRDSLAMLRYEHYSGVVAPKLVWTPVLNWHPAGMNTMDRVVDYIDRDDEGRGKKVVLRPRRAPEKYELALYVIGRSSEGDQEICAGYDSEVIPSETVGQFLELFVGLLQELMKASVSLDMEIGDFLDGKLREIEENRRL
ncbi:MAG: hypothetical protein LQ350_005700 [Teloschistes chrysophthalmus]|nr:MAG: hypothetical protein LQ350_005700 [Niorma chrysophthalma]